MSSNVRLLANRYEIEKIAGRGGTSVVYKAYDLQAERAVRAIKEISKKNVDVYEMAQLESALIKELYEKDKSNAFFPNIIHRFEIGDKFYIVQDFLDGESMDDMLAAGAMPYPIFIEAAKQICSFMQFFHGTGRVHSDMKPENIMVLKPSTSIKNKSGSDTPTIKLKFIDFGTAIKNETGVTGYTPEYAAPEQAREGRLDERTDIFNIGATFYHMIQGRKPKRVSNENRILTSAERFKFDKNVNVELKRIIQKCVRDDPNERYKTCDAVYRDLSRIEKRSHLLLVIASFIVAVVGFAGFGITSHLAKDLTEKNETYNYTYNVNSGNYEAAIKIDNTNRDDIYSKLIETFIDDEMLDSEEDNFIINEIKAKDPIKTDDPDYGRLMYEIGNAYWLYYYPYDNDEADDLELESDRISASFGWFEKAINDQQFKRNDPDAYARATIFYNIGEFYQDIDRKVREGTDDSVFYSDMWDNIVQLSEYIDDNNEVVSARVCQTLLSLISRYSRNFKQIGIKKGEQMQLLDQIKGTIYNLDGSLKLLNSYSIDIAENFDIEAVVKKLNMAYMD